MSWVELAGQTWPASGDDALLTVLLYAPDARCPRQWELELFHQLDTTPPRTLAISIRNLFFAGRDWRGLSGFEIRTDAAFHEANEYIDDTGEVMAPQLSVHLIEPVDPAAGHLQQPTIWRGHDFILRFGARQGLLFPCELEAWLIPADEYDRQTPEPVEAVKQFGAGPPTLRVMTRAMFARATVEVPRMDEPVSWARKALREEIQGEEMYAPQITWDGRATPDGYVKRPGWRSTVTFATRPEE